MAQDTQEPTWPWLPGSIAYWLRSTLFGTLLGAPVLCGERSARREATDACEESVLTFLPPDGSCAPRAKWWWCAVSGAGALCAPEARAMPPDTTARAPPV